LREGGKVHGSWAGLVVTGLVVSDAHPNADQVAFALSFRNDLFRSTGRQSADRRKELPLVGVRVEVGVNEYAVARLTRRKL